MKTGALAVCIGMSLILTSICAVSANEINLTMEVMPDMFVLSAKSPWLELDVYDPANEPGFGDYPSFEKLTTSGDADNLALEITNIKICNTTGAEIFNEGAAFDRYDLVLSKTTFEYVLAIMIARDEVNMNADFAENYPDYFTDGNLQFEVTGTIDYSGISGYEELGDIEFTASDSDVKVKVKRSKPAGVGNGGH
ncbi:hypothetical protein [Methanolobus sp. WCC4]|uniref:hypothetical protein n=1 Tax=Methanolobus sp. WCC4 TaxID=3125784 RepID=UPI0030F63009